MEGSLFSDEMFAEPANIKPEPLGNLVWRFPEEYIVLDTETTGLDPLSDEIIEFAGVKFRNDHEIERFQTFIKPNRHLDYFITQLTGITENDLIDAPLPAQALKAVNEFIGSSLLVAHNANFDIKFLAAQFAQHLNKPLYNNFFCTLKLSQAVLPEMENHKLQTLARFFEIELPPHRALADTLATAAMFKKLKELIEARLNTEIFLERQRHPYMQVPAKAFVPFRSDFDANHPFYKKNVVFTGKLAKFSRMEAMQAVANVGGINQDKVDEQTDFLVSGTGSNSSEGFSEAENEKMKTAQALSLKKNSLKILLDDEFLQLLQGKSR